MLGGVDWGWAGWVRWGRKGVSSEQARSQVGPSGPWGKAHHTKGAANRQQAAVKRDAAPPPPHTPTHQKDNLRSFSPPACHPAPPRAARAAGRRTWHHPWSPSPTQPTRSAPSAPGRPPAPQPTTAARAQRAQRTWQISGSPRTRSSASASPMERDMARPPGHTRSGPTGLPAWKSRAGGVGVLPA